MTKIKIIVTVFVTMFSLMSCNGQTLNFSSSFKEIKRISSPDKKTDAVLIETNGGATTSLGNVVFVVTPGKHVKQMI